MLDEEPVALMLVHGGPDAVDDGLLDHTRAACQAKLADFKVPAEFRVMEAFPRSTLEKIAKAQLRTMLEDEQPI